MEKEMHPEEGLNIGDLCVILSRERKSLEIWKLEYKDIELPSGKKEKCHTLIASETINPRMGAIEGIENALKTLISMIGIAEEEWNKD